MHQIWHHVIEKVKFRPILAKFGRFWLFCRKFKHLLVFFYRLKKSVVYQNWQISDMCPCHIFHIIEIWFSNPDLGLWCLVLIAQFWISHKRSISIQYQYEPNCACSWRLSVAQSGLSSFRNCPQSDNNQYWQSWTHQLFILFSHAIWKSTVEHV